MNDGRKLLPRVIAALGITALSGSMLVASPSQAAPDIDTVQARVDRLYHQAEQASERYNNARIDLQQSQHRLSGLKSDVDRQNHKVQSMRREVAASVVAQSQGQSLSSTSKLMLSDDPQAFIDQLTTVSQFNDQRSQMMADFALQAKRLEMRQADAKRELDRVAATKQKLGAEKARIDDKAAEAKALLNTLKERAAKAAAARAARAAQAAASRSQERTAAPAPASEPAATPAPQSAPASGRAGAAVAYALAQVGSAYVYGAAGPSAFDCSGLTMMAWQQAGVSLPHSSGAQMSSGTPVSHSDLQPGDLVFYYSPVSHVAIYIGNGKIVGAQNPSTGVVVTGVDSMPYSGAVRPG